MFAVEDRERVLRFLLELAEDDLGVVGAAVTGSLAAGEGDRWSDVDLALAIRGELGTALDRWTMRLYQELGALHHWDLRSGPSVYRVFLLPDWLEVDIAFTPEADFGARGPSWRLVFGDSARPAPAEPPKGDELAGLAWHHALRARASASNVTGGGRPSTGSAASATRCSPWPRCASAIPPPTPRVPTCCPRRRPGRWRPPWCGRSTRRSCGGPWRRR